MNFISYADGTNDLIDISNILGVPIFDFYSVVTDLSNADLLTDSEDI